MKNDKEFEMLLNEIPHATSSLNHHAGSSALGMYTTFDDDGDDDDDHHIHNEYKPSPVNGFGLQSQGSSLGSDWFASDDGSSPRRPLFLDEINRHKPQTQTPLMTMNKNNPHFLNHGLWSPSRSPAVESLVNGMGRMHVRDEIEGLSHGGGQTHFADSSPLWTDFGNVGSNGVFGNHVNGLSDLRRVNSLFPMSPRNFYEERGSALLGLQQNCQMGNVARAAISPGGYHSQCGDPFRFVQQQMFEERLRNLTLQADACSRGQYYDVGSQFPYTVPAVSRPFMNDSLLYNQQNPAYNSGREDMFNLLGSHFTQSKLPLDMNSVTQYSLPLFNRRLDATRIGSRPHAPPAPPLGSDASKLEAFNCEDSIIIQGNDLRYVIKKRRSRSKECKSQIGFESKNQIGIAQLKGRSSELADQFCSRDASFVNWETGGDTWMQHPLPLPLDCTSLLDIRDYIYYMSKDQHGCRYLQQKLDEGDLQDKQLIFQEIIDHVVELMMNPFGNYLVQKLLEKGSAEQRMKILVMVTKRHGELVKVSLNIHGTRAVQKLISSLKTQEEKFVVISALEPGFLDLIRDLNGNHVLQHCLQHLPNEENKFIFAAAAKFCLEIATHRHGCCVLQRCITYATGEDREILVSKVCCNALHLAQDAFGNYVIQFVLELKLQSANALMMSQFEGKYVMLSTQKFSSNVIEKCLKVFGEEGRSKIINELILSCQLGKLLQDPYANYVIQSALRVSKGPVNAKLIEAVRPYGEVLKSNPYCKKIFSWNCLRQ